MCSYKRYLPAEWYPQSFVQLTWPHAKTDWSPYLQEAVQCFSNIATEIAQRQKLLIVCDNVNTVEAQINSALHKNIVFIELPTDDTWARDHGAITILGDDRPILLDYKFNGWGNKFTWQNDTAITQNLYKKGVFGQIALSDNNNFILEGGSIESNGAGLILTTAPCLLNPNRNAAFSKSAIEQKLLNDFGAKKILWLKHGYLAGDDTDSHIDTLARFVGENTIMYISCNDQTDEHYHELKLMEEELKLLRNLKDEPFELIALPMATPVYFDHERLPATYANFLIINNAVLVPVYNLPTDKEAVSVFEKFYRNQKVIAVDCSVLIKQHGSLHCVTMQYPLEVDLMEIH